MIHILKLSRAEQEFVDQINGYLQGWDFSRRPEMSITIHNDGGLYQDNIDPDTSLSDLSASNQVEILDMLVPHYELLGYQIRRHCSGSSYGNITWKFLRS